MVSDNNRKYMMILTAMIPGKPIKLMRSIYPQIYKWCKNYALLASSETFILVARPDDVIGVAVLTKLWTWIQLRG